MIGITGDILKSVDEFKVNIQKYKDGDIEEFKSFSAFMGIYKERLTETYMTRPRIPGGFITIEQLKAVSAIAKEYAEGNIRFTTRQDIQFHSVKLDNLAIVLEDLIKAGLTTKGAGGDSVRNVACSPLSGVAEDEIFDVTPYVEIISNFTIKNPENLHLPRKFKISFSNSIEDTANATISDIGFIAKIKDGKKGFEVYAAGGLGGGPKISIKIEEFIEDSEALYYVEAMRRVFAREGDRANRHKARLRFVLQRLGHDEFIKVFNEELTKLRNEEDLKLIPEQNKDNYEPVEENILIEDKYKNIVLPQKQKGYYSVYVHPQNGTMSVEKLDKLINFIEKLKYDVSIRLTMTQGLYVRDLKGKDVNAAVELVNEIASDYDLFTTVTCAGPTICKFGINDSQSLLRGIINTFKNESDEIKRALPRIFVSGCPNSCGQHQRGLIGFTGKKKRSDKGLVPVYAISFDGRVGAGIAKFGEVYGDIPEEFIPVLLLELAKLKLELGYQNFSKFIEDNKEKIKGLVAKYEI